MNINILINSKQRRYLIPHINNLIKIIKFLLQEH